MPAIALPGGGPVNSPKHTHTAPLAVIASDDADYERLHLARDAVVPSGGWAGFAGVFPTRPSETWECSLWPIHMYGHKSR